LSSAIATFLFGTNPALLSMSEGFENFSIASYHVEAEGSGSFQIISTGAEGNKYLRITKNKEREDMNFA